ncbi:MAG: chitobiase/beta-hexosaminidase C-terminal domain-containing protein [Firmicutes bacterium]|nr:chitobiase/beta-hexosaminidase C-terminal domain-containing protein [Bacillota bacterium]
MITLHLKKQKIKYLIFGIVVTLVYLLSSQVLLATEVTGTITTGLTTGETQGTVIVVPTASPVAGTYTSTQSVTLTATGSTSIHYTISGTDPTCTTGTTYSGAISVSSTTTIEAISCYPNSNASTVSSFAYTINTSSSGGGGGGGAVLDITPPTNTSIVISAGVAEIASTAVILTLTATDAISMMISNDSVFTGRTWEIYSTTKNWILPTVDGVKTVYAKFKDTTGNISTVVSDMITLNTITPIVTPPVIPELITVPASSLNSAQITAIIALLQSFGADADVIAKVRVSLEGGTIAIGSSSNSITKLTKKISKSTKSEVMNLQTALNTALGASLVKSLKVDGDWGRLTSSAIKQFQALKKLDVDGIVGPMTRSALNTALGL